MPQRNELRVKLHGELASILGLAIEAGKQTSQTRAVMDTAVVTLGGQLRWLRGQDLNL